MYSVQQLLFDCTSYLQHHSSPLAAWFVGAVDEAFAPDDRWDVWVHRPALSRVAAGTVVRRIVSRFDVKPLPLVVTSGRFVFLGRQPHG